MQTYLRFFYNQLRVASVQRILRYEAYCVIQFIGYSILIRICLTSGNAARSISLKFHLSSSNSSPEKKTDLILQFCSSMRLVKYKTCWFRCLLIPLSYPFSSYVRLPCYAWESTPKRTEKEMTELLITELEKRLTEMLAEKDELN